MTWDAPRDELLPMDRYEWERLLRRCVLPGPVKAVGAFMAQYADSDGSRMFPGVEKLSAVTGYSPRHVRNALSVLREKGLLKRVRQGSAAGRRALADEYVLTRPPFPGRSMHLLDPDESPASGACDPSCEHPLTPARGAVDRVPVGAGTPAPHDTNTGTSCKNTGTSRPDHRHVVPPTKPLPTTDQPNYQRDNNSDDATTDRTRASNGHTKIRKVGGAW